MFIGAREASRILGEEAGVARQQARRVLLAGGRGAERVRRLRRPTRRGAMARIQVRVRIEKGERIARRTTTGDEPGSALAGPR